MNLVYISCIMIYLEIASQLKQAQNLSKPAINTETGEL